MQLTAEPSGRDLILDSEEWGCDQMDHIKPPVSEFSGSDGPPTFWLSHPRIKNAPLPVVRGRGWPVRGAELPDGTLAPVTR
jgi:hypothetical protein